MELWDSEMCGNLSVKRKKGKNLQKKRISPRNYVSLPPSDSGKDTSTEHEKRRKRVESSVSGKKLNIYLDSLEVFTHLDGLQTGEEHSIGREPPAFHVRGLSLVNFVPILICDQGFGKERTVY